MPKYELCPVCGKVMQPPPGSSGVYVCQTDHGLPPAPFAPGRPRFRLLEGMRNWRDRAYGGFFSDHWDKSGPLFLVGYTPQASQDGDGRLRPGPPKKAGGSKAKRKRKKAKKGGMAYVEPYDGEGETNRRK